MATVGVKGYLKHW